jgi:hypothetical protein
MIGRKFDHDVAEVGPSLGDYKRRGSKPEVPPISLAAFKESFALAKKEVEDLRKANNELHLALRKQK